MMDYGPTGRRVKPIAIYLKPADIELANQYAEKLGMSRSNLLRNLVHAGLQDGELLRKIGIATMIGAEEPSKK